VLDAASTATVSGAGVCAVIGAAIGASVPLDGCIGTLTRLSALRESHSAGTHLPLRTIAETLVVGTPASLCGVAKSLDGVAKSLGFAKMGLRQGRVRGHMLRYILGAVLWRK